MQSPLERFIIRVTQRLIRIFKNHKILITITVVSEKSNNDMTAQHVWVPVGLNEFEAKGIIETVKEKMNMRNEVKRLSGREPIEPRRNNLN